MHIPVLQKAVDGAGIRISAHDGSAVQMRRLVCAEIEMFSGMFGAAGNEFGMQRPGNDFQLLEHELVHFDVVVLPVKGHAQERLAMDRFVRRVQIQIVDPVGLMRAVHVHGKMVGIVFRHVGFPFAAPVGSARRCGQAGDRLCSGLIYPERRAAHKAVRGRGRSCRR